MLALNLPDIVSARPRLPTGCPAGLVVLAQLNKDGSFFNARRSFGAVSTGQCDTGELIATPARQNNASSLARWLGSATRPSDAASSYPQSSLPNHRPG